MRAVIISCENPKRALECLRFERELRASYKYYWKMKNGATISVKDMTDEHLDNTIAMLLRMEYEREIIEDNQAEVSK